MKNHSFDTDKGLYITEITEMPQLEQTSTTKHHDSVTITTLVVKENGESLL